MSAFLGPIHYWLYHKIELQEQMVEVVVTLGEEKGLTHLRAEMNERYGAFSKQPLEEIIDKNNIHGWLQDKVSRAEYKLADSVSQLLKKDISALERLKALFYQVGEKSSAALLREEDLHLASVYKAISDSLLDGMPCDHAVVLTKQETDEVAWETVHCVHTAYWNEVGGDIDIYYVLREAWLSGFVESLGLKLKVVGERAYAISKA